MIKESDKTTLDDLVATYGKHDAEIKDLKKVADTEKEQIKSMLSDEQPNWCAGGYKVTRVVTEKTTFNEERLLTVLKKDWEERNGKTDCPYIKTREYVDMDSLETALYENSIPSEVLAEMNKCKTVTPTIALRCAKDKEKKKED